MELGVWWFWKMLDLFRFCLNRSKIEIGWNWVESAFWWVWKISFFYVVACIDVKLNEIGWNWKENWILMILENRFFLFLLELTWNSMKFGGIGWNWDFDDFGIGHLESGIWKDNGREGQERTEGGGQEVLRWWMGGSMGACRENVEKVSTTPSDRGRSISSLRVPHEGDMVEFNIKTIVLSRKRFLVKCRENMENVT